MTINNIRYLYHAETGIELIFCNNSTISYPLHNHVSVLTIGIILDGSVVLTTNKETIELLAEGGHKLCEQVKPVIPCNHFMRYAYGKYGYYAQQSR